MIHTEQRSAGEGSLSSDGEFDQIRLSFLARLYDDQARLATLAAALGAAGLDPTAAFDDLEIFAHRMRGAAAVFGAPELSEDAKALELAVGVALRERGSSGEPGVWNALRTLTAHLTRMNGGASPSDASTLPMTAGP